MPPIYVMYEKEIVVTRTNEDSVSELVIYCLDHEIECAVNKDNHKWRLVAQELDRIKKAYVAMQEELR